MVQPPAVIPANAGIHSLESLALGEMSTALAQWIPACAGMTIHCVVPVARHLLLLSFVANQVHPNAPNGLGADRCFWQLSS